VSSDFIVGFCGETEESFQKSVELVRIAGFKNSFIFKYSERPGTKAAEHYPDDVAEEVKKCRNNDLLVIQNENSRADHRAQVGKTVAVLVEGPSRIGGKATGPVRQLTGRSMTDHIVVFDGPDRLIGQTVQLLVNDASPFTLYGTVLTDEVIGVSDNAPVAPSPKTKFSLPRPFHQTSILNLATAHSIVKSITESLSFT